MTRNSTRARRICFDAHRAEDDQGVHMICHICKGRIVPWADKWEADHIRRHAEGGQDTPDNLFPAHAKCHREKSKDDTTEVAKGKRSAEKHYGIKQQRSGLSRPDDMKYDWRLGRYVRVFG